MFDYQTQLNICLGMDLMGMLILIFQGITMLREKSVKGEKLNYMFCMLIGCFLMLASDVVQIRSLEGDLPLSWYLPSEGVLYAATLVTTLFLSYYMLHELRKYAFISEDVDYALAFLVVVSMFIWITGVLQQPNWFFDMSGAVPASKVGNYYIQIVPALIILFDLVLAASFNGEVRGRYLRAWIIVCLLPLIAVAAGIMIFHFPSYAVGSLSCLVLFFVIHMDNAKQQLISEKELESSRSQLMVSQIQPHFIYNSLNTIYYLIDTDQEQAKDALSTFSDYLRQNINALKDDKPVPFSEELEHIKAYVSLEQLRFGERLNVIYDIGTEDFLVPPLTIQPLVENAIKHGISVKEEGGKVKLMTKKTREGILLVVADNGVGFDTTRFSDDKKSTHIGLYNVRGRLMSMCGAELSVLSETGKGTVCKIVFPV